MNLVDANERYHRDADFRRVVDQMVNIATTLQMSPGELREAAVFAEIKIQAMKPLESLIPGRRQEIDALMRRHAQDREHDPNP